MIYIIPIYTVFVLKNSICVWSMYNQCISNLSTEQSIPGNTTLLSMEMTSKANIIYNISDLVVNESNHHRNYHSNK